MTELQLMQKLIDKDREIQTLHLLPIGIGYKHIEDEISNLRKQYFALRRELMAKMEGVELPNMINS